MLSLLQFIATYNASFCSCDTWPKWKFKQNISKLKWSYSWHLDRVYVGYPSPSIWVSKKLNRTIIIVVFSLPIIFITQINFYRMFSSIINFLNFPTILQLNFVIIYNVPSKFQYSIHATDIEWLGIVMLHCSFYLMRFTPF